MFKKTYKKRNKAESETTAEIKGLENISLVKSLDKNINTFKEIFARDETLLVHIFQNKRLKALKCCIFYIEGMVNNEIVNENIIEPVLNSHLTEDISSSLLEELQSQIIVANNIRMSSDINQIVSAIVYGDTALMLEGCDRALIISSKGWNSRAVEEAPSERAVRGPREGFTESIIVNLTLIRRRVRNPNLKFQFKEIGRQTRTKTCICYIDGIASPEIIDELYLRLDKIDIDGILDSGYIQEFIKDSPFSPFETIGSTERPDTVVGRLLEGRIALVVDGSPFVLTLPYLFIENFQASEDYYNNFIFSSFNRVLRIMGAFISISVPAIYVSLTNFHQEMVPTILLLSIKAGREDVPFPTVVEAFLMLTVFEILREAGSRMPTSIGQTVSIVGALVLGQAAVEAKFIAPSMIIVVALTGIAALMSMKIQGAMVFFRFAFLLLASFLGIYGFIFGTLGLIVHLMDMRSFGVPYMLSFGSMKAQDIKDTTIRAPWWYMYFRPRLITAKNFVRKAGKYQGGNTR